jgi:hypothetical protein
VDWDKEEGVAMKLKILLASIACIATLPSSAAAVNSPEITYPTGTKLATETKVRAVQVGESKLTWGATTLTCSSSQWKGTLKKNTGSEVEADLESVSFNNGGTCSSGGSHGASINTAPTKNGVPWCLRSTPELADDEFQIRGGKCAESSRPIRLAVKTTTTVPQECVFERPTAVVGTYQTHPGTAVLTSNGVAFTRVAGNVLCGTIQIDTSFNLEAEGEPAGPAYVSAGPRLTFPTGTALGVNSPLKGTNGGSIAVTSAFLSTACSGEFTGTLKANAGAAIEADIESASFGPGCFPPVPGNGTWTFNPAVNGLPWCLRATSTMAADEFQIRGNSCGAAPRPIRLVYEWPPVLTTIECSYERAAPLAGSYTTHPEDARFSFKNATFLEVEPKTAACPDEAQLDSSMTLESEAEGTKPIYVS